MAMLGCFLWWIVLGGLLGWLASWLVGKSLEGPAPAPIERIVEKPVDRVVEKIIDRPVEKIVEKKIDNPLHLSRISALEAEVALIAGLRSQISQLQSAPPKVVEKIVEKPVDRIVEKVVEKPVDRIVEKIVEKPVEKIVERFVEKPVDRIVEKPVDRIVEKIIEKPVEKIVEKVVEKVVEKRVDNPAHLSRIAALETEVAVIAGLRSQILQLQSAPPKVVEKIVEKPVDRVVEKPVDRIVEKIVEKPVEKIVEKVVEKMVDNPAHLSRIAALETEVAVIAGLRSQLLQLQSAPPKVVEKIVEKPVDRVVEKIVEKPVDRIVERVVEKPVEKIVVDTKGLQERDQQIETLRARLTELDGELGRLRRPAIDLTAAKAVGFGLKSADDLEIIEGIGPKIAELLRAEGITTFAELAATSPDRIRGILDKAGPNFRVADPGTWPEQAALAAQNRWQSLAALQSVLDAGVRTDPRATIKGLKADLADRDAEIKRLSARKAIDVAAAKAAGFSLKGADDLEIIEGIGPKIAELLRAEGITTFDALARTAPAAIQAILDKAGPNFRMANPATWPEQSGLAADNQWTALKALQDRLNAGNR